MTEEKMLGIGIFSIIVFAILWSILLIFTSCSGSFQPFIDDGVLGVEYTQEF